MQETQQQAREVEQADEKAGASSGEFLKKELQLGNKGRH